MGDCNPPLAKICSRCGGADSNPDVGPVHEIAPGLMSCGDCDPDVQDAALELEEDDGCHACDGEGVRGSRVCCRCSGTGKETG